VVLLTELLVAVAEVLLLVYPVVAAGPLDFGHPVDWGVVQEITPVLRVVLAAGKEVTQVLLEVVVERGYIPAGWGI
jgi:hypothetical protein